VPGQVGWSESAGMFPGRQRPRRRAVERPILPRGVP
jgi:hypothetical protein